MDTGIFWLGGMWLFPIIIGGGLLLFLRRGQIKFPWETYKQYYKTDEEKEMAFKNLQERYSKGEIRKDEFEEIKRRFFD